jgi:hypothetical protein
VKRQLIHYASKPRIPGSAVFEVLGRYRRREVSGTRVGSLIAVFVQAVAVALIVAVLTKLH